MGDIRRWCGRSVSIWERMDINVLRWYGHVERLEKERMVKKSAQCKGGR
jgi:hypothetical protein